MEFAAVAQRSCDANRLGSPQVLRRLPSELVVLIGQDDLGVDRHIAPEDSHLRLESGVEVPTGQRTQATLAPISSRHSRTIVSVMVSPGSTLPPGSPHRRSPYVWRRRRTRPAAFGMKACTLNRKRSSNPIARHCHDGRTPRLAGALGDRGHYPDHSGRSFRPSLSGRPIRERRAQPRRCARSRCRSGTRRGSEHSAPRARHRRRICEFEIAHRAQPVGMSSAAGREDDLLERSVHRLLHGRRAEELGRCIEQVVIDVHQSFGHGHEYVWRRSAEMHLTRPPDGRVS